MIIDRPLRCHKVKESLAATIAILADIKTGDIVIDPMVGGGSLLLQAIELQNTRCFVIGSDVEPRPATLARENLAIGTADRAGGGGIAAMSRSPFDVLFADVRAPPVLREASVDVCVSDLPFGKRCLVRHFPLNFHRFDRFELDLRGHTQP